MSCTETCCESSRVLSRNESGFHSWDLPGVKILEGMNEGQIRAIQV